MGLSSKFVNGSKLIVFSLLLLPSIFWGVNFFNNNLGVNPIDELMDRLGEMSLRLIILTLFLGQKYLRNRP